MSSHVLVLNAGSSSLKYSLVDAETGTAPATGSVERIGEARGLLPLPEALAGRVHAVTFEPPAEPVV